MKPVRLRHVVFALWAVFFAILSSRQLSAQARTSASKTQDIDLFAGVELANPEYGPNNNAGAAFGVDFTRYFRLPIQPSLELRANFNGGTYASEHSYLFGLRGAYPFRALTPYVDFLLGPGNIHYPLNVGYTGDNSIVYDFGGGLDLAVMRNFSLKLDLQQQRWNTGTLKFTPVVGIVGVSYRIPFRSQVGAR